MSCHQVVVLGETKSKVFTISPWPNKVSILFWFNIFLELLIREYWIYLLPLFVFWKLRVGLDFVLVGPMAIIVSATLLAHVLLKWRLSILELYPWATWVFSMHLSWRLLLIVEVLTPLKVILIPIQNRLEQPGIYPLFGFGLVLLLLWTVCLVPFGLFLVVHFIEKFED
jgi:hypothetical protein